MKAHFVNPYKSGNRKDYDLLIVENDNTSIDYNEIKYRFQLSFVFTDDDIVLENEAKRILNSIDETLIINEIIIDKPESWQF